MNTPKQSTVSDSETIAERQLADLFVANDDFDALERSLDVFCPFEAIGMVKQEIRHGHFLRYIFDFQKPHGFGDSCIRALMAAAARSRDEGSPGLSLLDIHMMDFEKTIVHRDEWRNVDILIEAPEQDLVVAIELKIDAKEHSGQLARYREIIKKEWPNRRRLLLFLTKQGDEPSEADGKEWQSVTLDTLATELQSVADKEVGTADARQLLKAYLSMLRRRHLNNEKLEELAAKLWMKHRAALEFLAERRPDAVGDFFQRLVDKSDELAKEVTAKCKQDVVTDSKGRSVINLAIRDWDEVSGFLQATGLTPSNRLILIQIVKAGPDFLRCYFQLGKGDQLMRKRLFDCLQRSGANVGKKESPSAEWTRLASIRIPLTGLDDNPEVNIFEDNERSVFNKVVDFASKHVPAYTKALENLRQEY